MNLLKEDNNLFLSYKYENSVFKHIKTGERIVMRSIDSWFMSISDKLKMNCL